MVDSNEGSQSRATYVKALLAAGYNQVPLSAHYPGADVAWLADAHDPPKRFAGQIKQPLDCILSWQRGTLQQDLYDLCQTVELPALILDGAPMFDYATGALKTKYGIVYTDPKTKRHPMPYNVWTTILIELTGFRPEGISFPIIQLPGSDRYLVEWLTKIGPERFDRTDVAGWLRQEGPPRTSDPRVNALMGFPGLGEQRIKDLLHEYGTVRDVLRAALNGKWVDEKGKGKIRGIGKKTQEGVLDVLTTKG